MKYTIRLLSSLLTAGLAFFILSCSTGDDKNAIITPENPPSSEDNSEETTDLSDAKSLIVYFSHAGENYSVGVVSTGNTAVMGGYIQEFTKSDSFVIEPEIPYPSDYDEMRNVSQQETADNARPKIKNTLNNLKDYSVVFVGSPIWYGAPPMIMRTFYETYDLSGKTIIPFGTHEGSGIGSCTTLLRSYFPNASILEGLGIRGAEVRNNPTQSRQSIQAWLQRIQILK